MPDRLAVLGTLVPNVPVAARRVDVLTPEEFEAALEQKGWASREELGGWTVLHYERSGFFRSPMGHCVAYSIKPTDPRSYIEPQENEKA